jgi:hypothetical protein
MPSGTVCTFLPKYADDNKNFQLCSCGHHVWSLSGKQVINISGRFHIDTHVKGRRTRIMLNTTHKKKNNAAICHWIGMLFTCVFFVMSMMILSTIEQDPLPF